MVTRATLCHVINGGELLLKRANRGISVGKWNAPGGKVERGESPLESARREVLEETGLSVRDLFLHGTIDFYMDGGKRLDIRVYLYSTRRFRGLLVSTDEGEVRWFEISKLPLERMWDDDRYWLPLILAKRKLEARFYYDVPNLKVTRYYIKFRD